MAFVWNKTNLPPILAIVLCVLMGIAAGYHRVETAMTWYDANDYCATQYGTTLATITSDAEATEILELIESGDYWSLGISTVSPNYWIGLRKTDSDGNEDWDGTWKWESGDDCDGACDSLSWWWQPYYPETYHDECGEAWTAGGSDISSLFANRACGWTFPFFCDEADDYEVFLGSQFVAVQQEKTWSDANDYCANTYGTTLATVRNDVDAQDLLELRQNAGSNNLWIGLNDVDGDGVYQWESGYPCGGDCLELEWWNEADSARYEIIQQSVTWSEANDYCANTYGTSLATIKDDDDAALLLSLWVASGSNRVWIGLNDQASATNWEWASGFQCDGACSDLSWWDGNEPYDNHEHCATLQVQDVDGMIHDWPCSTTSHQAFACDIQLQTTTLPCGAIEAAENTVGDMLGDYACTNTFGFACDAPVMGNRMAAVESGLSSVQSDVVALSNGKSDVDDVEALELRMQSMEKIIDDFNIAIDAERSQSVSLPVGFGAYGDYALYAVALANFAVLLVLFVYCMLRRVAPKVQYGGVAMYDTEKV